MSGPMPKEIVDAIAEMWADGKTDREMILILAYRGHHMTRNSVIGLRHRRGWVANAAKARAPRPPKPRLRNTIPSRAPGIGGVNLATFRGPEPVVEEPVVEEPVVEEPVTPVCRETAVEVELPELLVRNGPPTLLDLRPNECHWPVGREGEWTIYCGSKAIEGRDYCGPHYRAGHRPVTKRERL